MDDLRKVTWIGLWANLLISFLKLYVGLTTSSQALVADGWHSLSDCWSDFIILVASKYWAAPADECHPHGHRRIEVAVTVVIAAAPHTLLPHSSKTLFAPTTLSTASSSKHNTVSNRQ